MPLVPLFVVLAAQLGCGSDGKITAYTEPPLVTIQTPVDGSAVSQAVPVTLRGQVVDKEFEGSLEDITALWSANGTPICEGSLVDPAGNVECTHTFATAGEVTLSLNATNPDGASAAATVEITVDPNVAPTVTILAPTATGTYYADQLIDFQAVTTDDNDLPTDLVATWTSDLDGELSIDDAPDSLGELLGSGLLSEGRHLLTLEVEDTTGLVGSDEIIVEVGPDNSSPSCAITYPLNNDSFQVGETILFQGTATDADIDANDLIVSWTSNLDGELSTASPTSAGSMSFGLSTLTSATHTITLMVEDDTGATCSDAILMTVGNGPSILIEAPVTDAISNDGSTVTFQARASDPDDSATSLDILWTSSLDGDLSSASTDSAGVTSFTSRDLTVGTHTISASATDPDGFYAIDTIRLRINGLPEAPVVEILPSSPGGEDDLVATLTTEAVDPEGDTLSYAYAWRRNGASTSYTDETVPASATARGETWAVTVTPSDPYGSGATATDSVTIGNSLPTVASATITPTSPTKSDTLTCNPGSSADSDGDSVTLSYSWAVDGSTVSATTATLLPTFFDKGDLVTCTITPSDSYGSGTAVTSSAVTISNSAPTLTSATLAPTSAYEASTLTCTPAGGADVDGDSISYTYSWLVNGSSLGIGASTLDGDWFDKDDAVICQVVPSDGSASGTTVRSNTVTIRNTAPTLSSVSLSPSTAYVTTTLACAAGLTADDDGDSVSVAFGWTVNGATIASTGSSLSGEFEKGDIVACTGTPSDGTDNGTTVTSSTVTIQNSTPSASSVAISPSSPGTDDTLTAEVSGWSDADGDTEGYTYQWYVDLAAVSSGGTSRTLLGSKFVKGQSVHVVVTPTDGSATGTALTSDPVEVVNTAPTAPVVLVSPSDAEPEDDLLCSISTASTDADGDSISYSYTWWLEGVMSSVTSATLPASYTEDDDTWTCQVTPYDGEDYGPTGSDSQEVIDRTAPDRPIIDGIENLRNTTTVNLSGTAEAGSSITIYQDCSDGSLSSNTTTVNSSGNWSTSFTITRGLECDYYAYATDTSGNLSPASNTVTTESCNPHDSYEISTTSGNTCLDPIDSWAVLDDSGSTLIEITGNIISTSDEDWYMIDTSQAVLTAGTNVFNLEVMMVDGASDYTFEIYRGGCTTGYLECSTTGGLTEYGFYAEDKGDGHSIPYDTRLCNSGSPFYNDCDDLSTDYYIKVSRTSTALDCQHYTLEVTNGVW